MCASGEPISRAAIARETQLHELFLDKVVVRIAFGLTPVANATGGG